VQLNSEIHAEFKLITNGTGTKNNYKAAKVVKLIGGHVVHEPGLLPGEPVSPMFLCFKLIYNECFC